MCVRVCEAGITWKTFLLCFCILTRTLFCLLSCFMPTSPSSSIICSLTALKVHVSRWQFSPCTPHTSASREAWRPNLKENAPRSSNRTCVLTSGDDDRAKQDLLTLLSSFSLPEIQFWNQYLVDANSCDLFLATEGQCQSSFVSLCERFKHKSWLNVLLTCGRRLKHR